MNKMREIRIEKITLNVGVGEAGDKLDKASLMLQRLTNMKPIQMVSNKRIPTWSVRPGLAIGTKVTVRGEKSDKLLKRLLDSKDNELSEKNFDNQGNFSFGIPEYIEIPGIEYIVEVGIIGLEVAVTLERAGFRIKKRKYMQRKIPEKHKIMKKEAIDFVKKKYNVLLEEDKK